MLARASPTHPLSDNGQDTAFVTFGIITEPSSLLKPGQWSSVATWSKHVRIHPLKYNYKRGARITKIVAGAWGPKTEDITFTSYDRATYIELKTTPSGNANGTYNSNDDRMWCSYYIDHMLITFAS